MVTISAQSVPVRSSTMNRHLYERHTGILEIPCTDKCVCLKCMKFRQMILWKKYLNCSYQMSDFKAKLHQILFNSPRPGWGAYSALPDPLAGFKGPTSKEREGDRRGSEEGKKGMSMGTSYSTL